MNLAQLAERLGANLVGDGTVEISGVAGIEQAGPGQITFVSNRKYARLARTTRAAAVLVTPDFQPLAVPTLRLADPYLAYARAIEFFYTAPQPMLQIHPTAVIAPSARVGQRASIGPYAVIGEGASIGDDCVLHAHVVVYAQAVIGHRFLAHAHAVVREHCRLGDDVILQNGAVIGADGFGFVRTPGGWRKIVQSGPTILEDAVEVQANACIDRASIGETRIRKGTKIDNLVQVGHGSVVGEHTLLCAQVGLAGSTEVGRDVVLAGQVGVAGHCRVGNGVVATAQTGIPNDVTDGSMVSGTPAIENRQWLRSVALFHRLPELMRRMRAS